MEPHSPSVHKSHGYGSFARTHVKGGLKEEQMFQQIAARPAKKKRKSKR